MGGGRWLAGMALGLAACGDQLIGARLQLTVRDADTQALIGARVLLWDETGTPVRFGSLDMYGTRQGQGACQLSDGVVGSWDGLILGWGEADIPVDVGLGACDQWLAAGAYQVWAWRGPEYDVWQGAVTVAPRGHTALAISLHRAWRPYGALAADMHVHAAGSNDSRLPKLQRALAQAAAGIEVSVLSEHNYQDSLAPEVAALGLDERMVALGGVELTTDLAHVNVYPLPSEVLGQKPAITTTLGSHGLLAYAQAMAPKAVVQVNHPRYRWGALFDSHQWNGQSWPPPFDLQFNAVELLNGHTAFNHGADRRIDETLDDIVTLWSHGQMVAPLGTSDTHALNAIHDGTARTYVFMDAARGTVFDPQAFADAILQGRVVATTGPWLDVEVAPQAGAQGVGPGQTVVAQAGQVWLDVRVEWAAFASVTELRIYVGEGLGRYRVERVPVPSGARPWAYQQAIEVGAGDTWIALAASSDQPLPVEVTGSYLRDANHGGTVPFAMTGAIRVDNGDGRWQP